MWAIAGSTLRRSIRSSPLATASATPPLQFPVRALAAFARVHFDAGQSKTVTLHVPLRQLQYWSTADGKWITATGGRTVSVGASSRDLRLNQTIN